MTEYSKGKITVIFENTKLEPEEELVKDMMAIMNVYVAKMNGLRRYAKKQRIINEFIKKYQVMWLLVATRKKTQI